MDYSKALSKLLSLTDFERTAAGSALPKYDLTRMERFLVELGNPHLACTAVHIAGTKGKGSTAAMVTAVLSAQGYKVGLFTSPHLHTFRERIRIGDDLISEVTFASLVETIWPVVARIGREEGLGSVTTFEFLTAMAFCYFAQQDTNFQVLEVGLGGRLDSTNLVAPEVCAITSISLDHTAILGNTVAQIAREKAGIVKPGATVVAAPQPSEALEVIRQTCEEKGAKLVCVGKDVTWEAGPTSIEGQAFCVRSKNGKRELWMPLLGEHQLENAATAVGVLEALAERDHGLSSSSFAKGLASVRWPGRLEVLSRQPLLVVDGAHNPYSLLRLRQSLRRYLSYSKAIVVVGISGDKALAEMVREVAGISDQVIVTRSRHPRAASPELLCKLFVQEGVSTVTTENIAEALNVASRMAGAEDLVLVTGSLFAVAEATEVVKGIQPELYPTLDPFATRGAAR